MPETVHKDLATLKRRPNLVDYAAARASFDWEQARSELTGLPEGGMNICFEAVDRHARGDKAKQVAIRWLGKDDSRRELTYGQLGELSSRFASALHGLGLRAEDRVFLLLPRLPELTRDVMTPHTEPVPEPSVRPPRAWAARR